MQWAHPRMSAAPLKKVMGPGEVGIGSTSQRNNGPERSSRHHLLQMLWAHPAAPAAPLTSYQQQLNTMGPFEEVGSISAGTAHIINIGQINTIGRISLDFEVGPLVVPVHFYSMGPCGLFQLQQSNCTWVVPTTTTKVFDIMCPFSCCAFLNPPDSSAGTLCNHILSDGANRLCRTRGVCVNQEFSSFFLFRVHLVFNPSSRHLCSCGTAVHLPRLLLSFSLISRPSPHRNVISSTFATTHHILWAELLFLQVKSHGETHPQSALQCTDADTARRHFSVQYRSDYT